MPVQNTQTPPLSAPASAKQGTVSSFWGKWFWDTYRDVSALISRAEVQYIEKTITADDLDSNNQVTLKTADSTLAQYKIRDIFITGEGTNFDGSGDKDLQIIAEEGSDIYCTIPSVYLQNLVSARWGDYGIQYPETGSHMVTSTAAGKNIIIEYVNGSTGYSFTGEFTIVLTLERVD